MIQFRNPLGLGFLLLIWNLVKEGQSQSLIESEWKIAPPDYMESMNPNTTVFSKYPVCSRTYVYREAYGNEDLRKEAYAVPLYWSTFLSINSIVKNTNIFQTYTEAGGIWPEIGLPFVFGTLVLAFSLITLIPICILGCLGAAVIFNLMKILGHRAVRMRIRSMLIGIETYRRWKYKRAFPLQHLRKFRERDRYLLPKAFRDLHRENDEEPEELTQAEISRQKTTMWSTEEIELLGFDPDNIPMETVYGDLLGFPEELAPEVKRYIRKKREHPDPIIHKKKESATSEELYLKKKAAKDAAGADGEGTDGENHEPGGPNDAKHKVPRKSKFNIHVAADDQTDRVDEDEDFDKPEMSQSEMLIRSLYGKKGTGGHVPRPAVFMEKLEKLERRRRTGPSKHKLTHDKGEDNDKMFKAKKHHGFHSKTNLKINSSHSFRRHSLKSHQSQRSHKSLISKSSGGRSARSIVEGASKRKPGEKPKIITTSAVSIQEAFPEGKQLNKQLPLKKKPDAMTMTSQERLKSPYHSHHDLHHDPTSKRKPGEKPKKVISTSAVSIQEAFPEGKQLNKQLPLKKKPDASNANAMTMTSQERLKSPHPSHHSLHHDNSSHSHLSHLSQHRHVHEYLHRKIPKEEQGRNPNLGESGSGSANSRTGGVNLIFTHHAGDREQEEHEHHEPNQSQESEGHDQEPGVETSSTTGVVNLTFTHSKDNSAKSKPKQWRF